MVLADYEAYLACQENVDTAFKDRKEWTRKTILNVANIGRFSVDRLVQQYASDVWNAKPISEGSNA
jgi:starch phosphorylase